MELRLAGELGCLCKPLHNRAKPHYQSTFPPIGISVVSGRDGSRMLCCEWQVLVWVLAWNLQLRPLPSSLAGKAVLHTARAAPAQLRAPPELQLLLCQVVKELGMNQLWPGRCGSKWPHLPLCGCMDIFFVYIDIYACILSSVLPRQHTGLSRGFCMY